ncbi:YppF family protein [Bacillus solimangrovi]|uniref:YppF family protein n=1 Tax=Bacillus solimangrovi TaxID=1305675 RepID=UPI0009F434AB|nr:YppF family protein [Bacillus solimangrovi]
MTLENLIDHYTKEKNNKPENTKELIGFIRRAYVCGDINIVEYRNLYRELEQYEVILDM